MLFGAYSIDSWEVCNITVLYYNEVISVIVLFEHNLY